MDNEAGNLDGPPPGIFQTTHWSVVLAARHGDSSQANAALEFLCATYWYPLYTFVRRRGHGIEEAQDLTQDFFARLVQRDFLRNVARERGRFRTFLLAALKNFLITEWHRGQAMKRGGGQCVVSWDALEAEERYALEPASALTPDLLYEREWAVAVMEQAMAQLREEHRAGGKEHQFDRLKQFLTAEAGKTDYAAVAGDLNLKPGAVAVAVHRMRRRYSELIRGVVAQTVSGPADVEDELQVLARALQAVPASGP